MLSRRSRHRLPLPPSQTPQPHLPTSTSVTSPPPTQVARRDHFAPVKNAPGSETDSPDTARALLLEQGARWAAAAGAEVAAGCKGVEVPPLVSYAGEGLEGVAEGLKVGAPGPWLLGADGTLSAGK